MLTATVLLNDRLVACQGPSSKASTACACKSLQQRFVIAPLGSRGVQQMAQTILPHSANMLCALAGRGTSCDTSQRKKEHHHSFCVYFNEFNELNGLATDSKPMFAPRLPVPALVQLQSARTGINLSLSLSSVFPNAHGSLHCSLLPFGLASSAARRI